MGARWAPGVPIAIRRLLLPCGALVALALPAPALAACDGADTAPTHDGAVHATLCLLNAQRAAHHLSALTESAPLDKASDRYARDMVSRKFFDHVSPGGSTVLERIKAAGWVAASGSWSIGENIAWGSGSLGTPAAIVDGWMHSAGHRANILNDSFEEIGIGIAAGAPRSGISGGAGTYVTDFGSDGKASAAAATPAKKPAARCATKARGTLKRCARR
jgi:uncharacterized protein YkwD